jgi:hypothetical protein
VIQIVWRFFKTVLLQIPTELQHTRADIYTALLYSLGIHHHNPYLGRRDVANFYVRPKLAALEACDDLCAFNDFVTRAWAEADNQLHSLEHQTSSGGLVLPNKDPVIAAVFFRALWSNKIQFLEDDGQLRSLAWWELIDLSNFTKHMGADGLLSQKIKDELQSVLGTETDTDLIHRHMVIHAIEDQAVFRLCELELTKRKMKQLSMKEPEDDFDDDDDWEVVEHPRMD